MYVKVARLGWIIYQDHKNFSLHFNIFVEIAQCKVQIVCRIIKEAHYKFVIDKWKHKCSVDFII